MSGQNTRECGQYPAVPNFQFGTPQFQNAANTVYNAKIAYDTNPANVAAQRTLKFQTDFQRMQALIGSKRVLRCGGQS
jgi:hypothetical protein